MVLAYFDGTAIISNHNQTKTTDWCSESILATFLCAVGGDDQSLRISVNGHRVGHYFPHYFVLFQAFWRPHNSIFKSTY